MNIVLASASPRRQLILEQMGIAFKVMADDTPEAADYNTAPEKLVEINAFQKANNISAQVKVPFVVIGADTIVFLEDKILGKPKNRTEAKEMLSFLSGKTHTVYTGVCLIAKGAKKEHISFVDCAKVFMNTITPTEIEEYINTGEPMDKAGAYAIQGIGAKFVANIEGDYYTVVGLPKEPLRAALNELGCGIASF